jgi:hypothetical protein
LFIALTNNKTHQFSNESSSQVRVARRGVAIDQNPASTSAGGFCNKNSMNIQTFSTRLTFSFAVLLATCMVSARPAIASGDDQAVAAATKKYLATHSYPAGMKVTVEKVVGDYARVAITPKDPKSQGGLIFLKREHGVWKVLSIGTGWDPADLDAMHIPKTLRP